MTTSQGDKPEVMLKAVIEKAVKNGWNKNGYNQFMVTNLGTLIGFYTKNKDTEDEFEDSCSISIFETLLSHSFAKAYWGEEDFGYVDVISKKHIDGAYTQDLKLWQYHLQQAVIAPNALIYYFERL